MADNKPVNVNVLVSVQSCCPITTHRTVSRTSIFQPL